MDAKTIYPAHGNSFPAEIIQKVLTGEINNGK